MEDDRYSRQSFLGEHAEEAIGSAIVGMVGLGGGGSHIGQQLAHVGFKRYRLFEPQRIERSNLNRTIGATEADVAANRPKLEIMERLIRGLQEGAEIIPRDVRWQEDPDPLRECDLVFGCVDSFQERRDLEALTRRYMIPFIDIGLDVHRVDGAPPRMGGQVILSMPGGPCMWCLGFLTEERLATEAALYGAAGPRPQVVWGNGVLASLAVGLAVDLLTDWTRGLRRVAYLSYDANIGTVCEHVRVTSQPHLQDSDFVCPHFPLSDVGPVEFKPL